jgi:copper chaperone CopZ
MKSPVLIKKTSMFNRSICIFLFFAFLAVNGLAQSDTVRIQTSAICGTCKKIIENDMSFVKGVKKSELDLGTSILTVVYNSEKTDPDKIRIAVTKTGYDADSLVADPKAFKRLPECCKNPMLHGK